MLNFLKKLLGSLLIIMSVAMIGGAMTASDGGSSIAFVIFIPLFAIGATLLTGLVKNH